MSTATDLAVVELQKKVAWLEREIEELRALRELLRQGADNLAMASRPEGLTNKANGAVNGTLHVKRK